MADEKKIEDVLGRISRLPSLPDNIQKINHMIDNRNSPLENIGRAIADDQTLSAQVLKLINSGFYGLSNKVSSISHAVILLGLNVIRSLISTAWASSLIAKSFPGLYDHSMACSRTCFLLSRNLKIDVPEEVSTIGLLHDIGKVVLAEYLPDEFSKVRSLLKTNPTRFYNAEKNVMGFSHDDIAKWLLKKWNLPKNVIDPIADHHKSRLSSEYVPRTSILILANVIVHAEGFGWGGDNIMPELPSDVTDALKLQPNDLRVLMDEVVDQMQDIPRCDGEKA